MTAKRTIRQEWLNAADAATYTGMSRKRLSRAANSTDSDYLPAKRNGRYLHFKRDDLDKWLESLPDA